MIVAPSRIARAPAMQGCGSTSCADAVPVVLNFLADKQALMESRGGRCIVSSRCHHDARRLHLRWSPPDRPPLQFVSRVISEEYVFELTLGEAHAFCSFHGYGIGSGSPRGHVALPGKLKTHLDGWFLEFELSVAAALNHVSSAKMAAPPRRVS